MSVPPRSPRSALPLRLGSCLALTLTLAVTPGCLPDLSGNPPRDASVALPDQFAAGGDDASSADEDWTTFFDDPHLIALIEGALDRNQELNMQLQEILIAKYEVSARRGEYLPRLDAGLRGGVEKVGRTTSQGRSDELTGVPEHLPDLGFGFSASWEVDVWSKLRNASKAAYARYLASIEGRRFTMTQLVAEIAHSYYELMALDRRLEVLESNIQIQQDALDVIRLQKAAGRANELAVQRFEAEVLKNESRRYAVQQEIVAVENRINLLVGRPPQAVARSSARFDAIAADAVRAGVPSDLLDNRPDIRRAKLMMEAAKLDVASAKAAFYPSFSIDADVGYEAFNPSHIVDTPDSIFYKLAGNLTAPLLNRTAIEAQYRMANATQLQAVIAYERAVLRGFTEVATQVASIDNFDKAYARQARQVEKLQDAIEVSRVLFRSARADYMEVLMTRRDALESQLELIETKARQLHAMVNLYQALGGGWRGAPALPEEARPEEE